MFSLLERASLEALRDLPGNIKVVSRLARDTGLGWALSPSGAWALARVAASGSQNPSLLYRVHAKNTPSKPALIWRGRTTTWAELDERIDRIASGLERRGIGRKQSLIVMMRNRQECVELGAATTRAGAASVSISWRSTAKEGESLANDSVGRGMA